MNPNNEPDVLIGSSIKASTPDGSIFIQINELNGKPIEVTFFIGKAGSSIQAWSQALSSVINLALHSGVEISTIAETLSGITSDRISFNGDKIIRSVPDAISQAIITHLASKGQGVFDRRRRRRRGPSVFGEEIG